jgi:hypothetical protein
MPSDKKRDYEIGYARPPRHTRFKKGQSGNPKGRPGGTKNLSTLVNEALNERVIVAEDGGQRKITKRQAIVKQIVNRSAAADWRAARMLFDIVQRIESRMEAASSETAEFTAADEKVLAQLKTRLLGKKRGSND